MEFRRSGCAHSVAGIAGSPFTFFALRAPSAAFGSRVYPLPGERVGAARREPLDGDFVHARQARGVRLRFTDGKRDLAVGDDLALSLYITDARLIVSAMTLDADLTWRPGYAAARPDDRAGSRMTGRVLLGHLRLPWLHGIEARGHRGGVPTLRAFVETAGHVLRVDIGMTDGEAAASAALDIARRAAALRLTQDPAAVADSRATLERIAALENLPRGRSSAGFDGLGLQRHRPVESELGSSRREGA